VKGDRIGIKDFPVGLNVVGSVCKVSLDSFHTKICHYEVYLDSNVGKKRKFAVVKSRPQTLISERAVQVVGARVKGSCGAPYFNCNGKVIAFHVESVDDGEDASATNSYNSDWSHTSHSIGLVLCRLPKFMAWYENNAPDKALFTS
jgi:hypothetical protein